MRDTWYKLENGEVVSPADVAPDKSGALVHKSGVAVAMNGSVPHSFGVELDDKGKRIDAADDAKELEPEPKKSGYKTRETKAK